MHVSVTTRTDDLIKEENQVCRIDHKRKSVISISDE